MDRLDELAVFIAIVEAGSLTGAARRLRRSTTSVTRSLAAIETRVGVRLIERSTRRLAVTPAGSRLAARARALLADYEAAARDVADDPIAGVIRLTAPVPFGRLHMTPIVADFLAAHPRVQVELVLADHLLDLIDEGLDIAVRIGALPDSALLSRRVGTVRQVLVASPGYLARRGTPAAPFDLADHDVLFGLPPGGFREWRFGAARDRPVRLEPRVLVNDVEARLAMARAGHGITRVLSYQAMEAIADGTLVRVLSAHEPTPVPVQLVTRAGPRAARVGALLDTATDALRKLAALRDDAM